MTTDNAAGLAGQADPGTDAGTVTQVDPDTEDEKRQLVEGGHLRFEQDPGDLTTVYQHIVRPFVCEPPELR